MIIYALYICSESITLARWCGKVMSDMLSLRSALFLTVSESPNEEPIIKQIFDLPDPSRTLICSASFSLENFLPSMHRATVKAPSGICFRISRVSFSSAFAISPAEGVSPVFCSLISTHSNFIKAPSLLEYSSKASI